MWVPLLPDSCNAFVNSVPTSHILGIKCFSSHRTRIKCELCREVHACRESKWIHIEHGVVRVQELRHGTELLTIVAGLNHRLLLLLLLLVVGTIRGGNWLEGRWIGPWPRDF